MKFSVPQNVNSIISIINSGGFSAHLVGGCVRDMILGREPKDWDITTNANPDQIKPLFKKTYDTGLKHGTVTAAYKGTLVEVTTWRRETTYTDHRRPDQVIFTESLTEDLARRDFTMNAIAWHPMEGIVDPYNGLSDIRNKIIRCVGDPYRRYSEDALRMLRAVRFSAQLNFDIEKTTFEAIKSRSKDAAYISIERIQNEITKILDSEAPQKLALMWDTGLSKAVFPEISSVSPEWLRVCPILASREHSKIMLLGLLLSESFGGNTAERAKSILRRLKYDNETLTGVSQLIQGMRDFGTETNRNLRRLVTEYGETTGGLVLQVLNALKKMEGTGYPLHKLWIKPAVSGLDLQKACLCEGREIGILLTALALCLYEKPELNSPETLMLLAEQIQHKFQMGLTH